MISGDSLTASPRPISLPDPPSARDIAALDAWLTRVESDVAASARRALSRIVNGAVDGFLSTLTASGDLTVLDSIPGEWTAYVDTTLAPTVAGIYMSGSMSAFVAGNNANPIPPDAASRWLAVVNENAVEYQRLATNRLVGVGDSVWGYVRGFTVDALEQGKTNEELKGLLSQVFGFTEYRADTIGRTETVAAYNGGDYDGAVALAEFGPAEKVWVAAIDARTRQSHAAADNQTVAFASPFQVGGVAMMRPHDPGAPAREVVNCRCVLALLYPGDTRPDGSVVEDPNKGPDVVRYDTFDTPLRLDPNQPALGGAHAKSVYIGDDGERYLFKPMDEWVAHGEAAASDIARRAGLDVPEVWVHEIDGRVGSLQRMTPNARNAFGKDAHGFDPTKVTAADLDELQRHRVLDWAIGNHDAHANQFIRPGYASQGARVVGIDKGQAFKHFGDDRLDWKYHPNGKFGEADPVYNKIEQAFVEDRLPGFRSFTTKAGDPIKATAERIAAIPDDEYRAMLRVYAEGRWPNRPNLIEAFLDDAVKRKNNLVDDFTKYHRNLTSQRTTWRKRNAPPKAIDGTPGAGLGGPRGMTGAAKSKADVEFMRQTDHPITSSAQSRAAKTYTGGSYSEINGAYRRGEVHPTGETLKADLAKRPVKADMEVYRGVYLGRHVPDGDVRNLQGAVFHDRAFLSTSAGEDLGPAFDGDTAFRIRVNEGSAGAYVREISQYHHEREFILQADSHLYVHTVRRADPSIAPWEGKYQWIVEAETVSAEWAQSATGVRVWDSNLRVWK